MMTTAMTSGSAPDMTGPMWMPTAPPTTARLLAVHLQPVPVLPAIAVALLVAYLVGVAILTRRGDRWPIGRTLWWLAGISSVLAVTATGLDGYGMWLFSVHMIQHMVLSMLSPVLLVLGAPVTLLLRALPARHGGGWNARRVVLAVIHSAPARVIAHPAVTVTLFLVSLYGLYFTPVFDLLMSTMAGHNVMLLHFLAVGALYFWSVLGVDPTPRWRSRSKLGMSPEVGRILEVVVTVPFHAFFGVVVMMSTTLITGFYANPPASWGIGALADQRTGGGIAWSFTEIPTLLVLGVLLSQWQRSEARAERTAERQSAKAEAEREAYNAYLARIAEHDRVREPR